MLVIAELLLFLHQDLTMYMKKVIYTTALPAMCLAVLLLVSCSEKKQKRQDAAQYQTMVVSRKDMTLERQYSARLTGRQIVEVRPQVSGCITRILTGEGEAVRKGQTLFVIDQVPYRAASVCYHLPWLPASVPTVTTRSAWAPSAAWSSAPSPFSSSFPYSSSSSRLLRSG